MTHSIEDRGKKLLAIAQSMYDAGASYLEISNALFGIDAPCGKLFPSREEREKFLASPQHKAIRKLMSKLPMPHESLPSPDGPSGKFLIRVPQSLHAALQAEAEAEGVSLNQLAVAKLAISLGKATVSAVAVG